MLLRKNFPFAKLTCEHVTVELPHGSVITPGEAHYLVLLPNNPEDRKKLRREVEMLFGVWLAPPTWGPWSGIAELAEEQPTHRIRWFDLRGREHGTLLFSAGPQGGFLAHRRGQSWERATWMEDDAFDETDHGRGWARRSSATSDDWYSPIVTSVDALVDPRTLAAHQSWPEVRAALLASGVPQDSEAMRGLRRIRLSTMLLLSALPAAVIDDLAQAATQRVMLDTARERHAARPTPRSQLS